MSYKGFYKVKNLQKYRGDPTKCVFRSLWERKFMKYCDFSDQVLEWSSEEVRVPYKSPIDGRFHWYFVDFWTKVRTKAGGVKTYLIEIKPKKQTVKPQIDKDKKNKKTQIIEVKRYLINKEKWESAKRYCEVRDWEFLILTEDNIFGKNEQRNRKNKKNTDKNNSI